MYKIFFSEFEVSLPSVKEITVIRNVNKTHYIVVSTILISE